MSIQLKYHKYCILVGLETLSLTMGGLEVKTVENTMTIDLRKVS